MKNIKLGKEYTDSITGFKGVATAYIIYITGCIHIELTPKVSKTGGLKDLAQWFDESRLDPKSGLMEGVLAEAAVATMQASRGPGAHQSPASVHH
jgi:hypothetical protein